MDDAARQVWLIWGRTGGEGMVSELCCNKEPQLCTLQLVANNTENDTISISFGEGQRPHSIPGAARLAFHLRIGEVMKTGGICLAKVWGRGDQLAPAGFPLYIQVHHRTPSLHMCTSFRKHSHGVFPQVTLWVFLFWIIACPLL
jgi:hypothetical protein